MKFLIYTLLFSLFCLVSYGQNTSDIIESGIPRIEQFNTKNLGGESQNLSIIQDKKGVLIVANSFGFLTFNGAKWNSFKPSNDGVPISFSKTEKGLIYTAGSEFIGYLDTNNQGHFTFKDLKDKLPKGVKLGFIWNSIYENNKVYFQNDKNILIYHQDSFSVLSDTSSVNGLFRFENEIYVSTSKGLYKINNNKLELISSFFSLNNISIKSAIRTSNNQKYFISFKNGLYEWSNSIKKSNSLFSRFLEKNTFTDFKILHDSNYAFATSKGGFLLTDTNLKPILRLSEKTGLTHNNTRNIYQDNHNNIWLACQSGITKINYPYSTTFFNFNKENYGTVEEITRFKNDLFLGTGKGTFKLESIPPQKLYTENHFPSIHKVTGSKIFNFANIVIADKLIYGGQNETNLFDGSKTVIINTKEARKFHSSKFHKNTLFMGHKYGFDVLLHDNDVKISKTIPISNFSQQVRGISEINKNNIWLTTVSDGVYKLSFDENFENQKIKRFGLNDGLPSLRDNLVYTLNNNDIIFTTHKGLFKFDEISQKFIPETRFGEKYAGGKDEFIYAFNFDKNENAWMHSFRNKIAIVALKDTLGKYTLNEKKLKDIGKLQAYEILSEPDKNIVWFGGSDGLARVNVSKTSTKKDTLFYAIISKVIGVNDSILVDGHQFDKNVNTTLSASERDIRFEVGATDFTNIKETKFQYLLQGYDKNWSEWSKEPFKIYTNLPHGNYTFKVRAKNYTENISVSDYYTFSIAPFWYQTKLITLILFLLIFGFISYVANFFSKRKFVKKVHQLKLIQKFEQEKNDAIVKEKERSLKALIDAQETERSRIARELHDGVVQQIGSVILKSRHILSKLNLLKTKESQELLESLENSNRDLRTISHQMMPIALKELGILSALNDLLDSSLNYSNINYSLEHYNILERLPQRIEITIYRIVQELINNIIKHSKATEVSVQLFNANNTIILIVEDNGIGFSSEKKKKGIGLLNISSRLDMVNGDVNFEPSPKSGTLITIKIPLQ